MTDQSPVAEFYDAFTDLLAEALGGNIHMGYWTHDDDPASIAEATDRLTDMVIERLGVSPEARVLDVGFGTGKPALRTAAATDAHVTGITVSTHQHAKAQDIAGDVDFVLQDVHDLAMPDASFDGAYAIESILHVTDADKAIAHIARVLRPGARFVIADGFLRRPAEGAQHTVVITVEKLFQIDSLRLLSDLSAILRRNGFDVTDVLDITPNMKPTLNVLTDFLLSHSGPDADRRFRDDAEMIRRLGDIPEFCYAIITCTRQG